MGDLKRVCRLCLKICDNFNAVEGDLKDVLDVVLPKMDLAAIQKSVMCTNCTETLIECLDFKATCFDTHDYIVPFMNDGNVKLDLKNIYLEKSDNGIDFLAEQDICGFCMGPVQNCSATSLNVEEGVILKKMIEECLPELNFSVIMEPVICAPCLSCLEKCFHFVKNCLNVEEKNKNYYKTLDVEDTDKIELSSLLQCTMRDETISEMDPVINVEKQHYKEGENAKETNIDIIGDIFKLEEENFIEIEDHKLFDNFDFDNEEIEMKTDEHGFNRFKDDVLPQQKVAARILMRKERSRLNYEDDLLKPYMKPTLTNANAINLKMHHCNFCSYQTSSKSNLNVHMQRHKDPSEVTMYKCNYCLYQSRLKGHLKRHQLSHASSSEVTMYKCECCSFKTKHKNSLKSHVLMIHASSSEVKMYKCNSCLYQTRRKPHLERHLLTHKNSSEGPMFKCDICLFLTRHKNYLKTHSLVHKNPSEVTMHKCGSCSFQTKYTGTLKKHLLVHEGPSQVQKYQCHCCSYETKDKYCFNKHMLLHKNPSEVTVYNCYSCTYQTRHKHDLIKHLLVHKNPSEITMYKCDYCSYQVKQKGALKSHLLVHKTGSEATMYKCDSCSFRTKHKGSLKAHQLVHKCPSDRTVYICDICSVQKCRKGDLKKHLRAHKQVLQ